MNEDNNIIEKDNRLADYAMAFELVSRITSYESEETAIDNIMYLFRNLCAPSRILYISIVDGKPSEIRTFPENINPEAVIGDLINNFKDDYAWTTSGAGFRLKIKGRDGVFGLIEIDGVLFPNHKNHYLNLSLTIASALGLAIPNARVYQSLLNANKQLEQEHSFRKAIEESVMAGIAATDVDGRQIYVNPSFCKMFGYEESELLGIQPPYPYWALEDSENISDALRCTIEEKAPKEGFDLVFMKKTGERLYVNVLISPLVSKNDEKTGWLASVYDITKRKMLEDELKIKTHILSKLNKKLERIVDDKIKEIRQKEQLLIQQSKMAAMGEMIAAIAHQWKQPLNAMSLNIQDIKDAYEFGELNKEYIDNMIETSNEQVAFMAKTIDYFRNFFRPSKEKTIFNVVNSINEMLSMFKEIFKKSSISIDFLYDKGNELECAGYPNEFKQVILNLINNSKDAIVARRSKDTSKYLEGKVSIVVQREDHAIVVIIGDNGGGIPDAIIEKIFDPYFTTKPSDIGTGIGLYMSRTIIETNMGGTVTVHNVDGGAEFKISLKSIGVRDGSTG